MKPHAGLVLLVLLCAGCGGPAPEPRSPVPPPEPPRKDPARVEVRFDCVPEDAELAVDGEIIGIVSEVSRRGPLHLLPGLHRFVFSKGGYVPFRIELRLKNTNENRQVRLEPVQ